MRKRKKEILQVTSFRLPADVKLFLYQRAKKEDRTMSYLLVQFLRERMVYEDAQAKQPKVPKAEA